MKKIILTSILSAIVAFVCLSFSTKVKPETNKTYYYYLEIIGDNNGDYSYDVIYSKVKSASCDWDNSSKYGYPPDAFQHIAIAFDEWFRARYDNWNDYTSGYEAFGNRKLYNSRSEAESARNKSIANRKNSNVKYVIKYDDRFNYICK